MAQKPSLSTVEHLAAVRLASCAAMHCTHGVSPWTRAGTQTASAAAQAGVVGEEGSRVGVLRARGEGWACARSSVVSSGAAPVMATPRGRLLNPTLHFYYVIPPLPPPPSGGKLLVLVYKVYIGSANLGPRDLYV